MPGKYIAQVLLFEESFDFYQDQSFAGVVSPYMGTWSGNTGFGTDDCQITNLEAFSQPNSISIYGPNAGGQIDAMVNFPSDYTSGKFEFTMKFKIAENKGGYYNFQSSSANVGNAWMMQVFFATDSTGKLYAGGNNFSFDYTNGEWIDFKLECDLDLDTAFIWIENNLVGTGFKWSLESNGAGNGSNHALGGINLYSTSGDPSADCEYYVDDLLLIETTGLSGVQVLNSIDFTIYPNPGNGIIEVSTLSNIASEIFVVDANGRIVYKNQLSDLEGVTAINLEVKPGVYTIMVYSNREWIRKKYVVIR